LPLSERSERLPDYSLSAKPVDGRSEALIEIETGGQALIVTHLVDPRSKHDTLPDVR
jgi:hypothetical protein